MTKMISPTQIAPISGVEDQERILGLAEDDTLTGGAGNDRLHGGDGDDTLTGGAGNDRLHGGDGDDTLTGGAGDDRLHGGDGDDTLTGGAGDDILNGGNGRDRYYYGAVDLDGSLDKILSFKTGVRGDILDLSEALQGATRNNLSDYFEISYHRGSTWLAIDSDGDGSGFVDLTIQLKGVRLKSITELEHLILDGNLLISNKFEWQPGDGDRTIDGGPGEDTVTVALDEETSSNVFITPDPDGTIKVTRGDEILTLDNVEELVIEGTEGDDHIVISGDFNGTDLAPNTINISGLSGMDIIDASDLTSIHRVVIDGGDGDDTLTGGSGDDSLSGGAGDDTIDGNGGDDWLSGGLGDDDIDGGTGIDTVDYSFVDPALSAQVNLENGWGGVWDFRNGAVELERDDLANIENVIGSDGDDALIGDDRNNLLIGNAGNDWINGRSGDDDLRGGGGDDRLFGAAGDDLIDGGAGVDTVDYSTTASYLSAQVNLTDGWGGVWDFNGVGELERDTLSNIENAVGAAGNDALIGNDESNRLAGGAGNDWINGKGGDDTLLGEEGEDSIFGESGNDYLDGGAGDDTLIGGENDDLLIGGLGSDDIQGGSGVDTIDYSTYHTDPLNNQLNVDLSTGLAFELLSGVFYRDTISGVENVTGSMGQDWLKGDDEANRLDGLGGNDKLFGGDNDDTLVGGYGNDVLSGGAGNDTVDYSYLAEVDESVGVLLGLNMGVEVTSQGVFTDEFNGIENVIGSQGADLIVGDSFANRLEGRGGDDLIAGGYGNDVLIGGFGDDTLKGNEGRDTVDYSYLDLVGFTRRISIDLEQGLGEVKTDRGLVLESDSLQSIENVIGTSGDDNIVGDDASNILSGRGGDDYFFSGIGFDTIDGGSGFDTVRLSGRYIDYDIVGNSTYATIISKNDNELYGRDELYSIEMIEFDAGQVDQFYLDGTPNTSLPPELTGFSVNVAENASPGILGTVSAFDAESTAVTFKLAGDYDEALFQIDPGTGVVSTLAPLNYEEHSWYNLTVVGTDADGLYNTTEVQVGVLDVNEAAIVEGDKIVAMGSDSGPVNLGIKLPVDPEGDPLSVYIVSVPDNGSIYLENGDVLSQKMTITPEDLSGLFFVPDSQTLGESGFTYEVIDLAAKIPVSITINVAAPVEHMYGIGLELEGGTGDDILVSSNTSDFMVGMSGTDTFIFTDGDRGSNGIADFNPAEGDRLDLSSFLSQVYESDLSQYFTSEFDGKDTTIKFDLDQNDVDEMSITFEDINLQNRKQEIVIPHDAKESIVERVGSVPLYALQIVGTDGELTFYDADLLDTHEITSITAPTGALGALTATISQDTTLTASPGVIEWVYNVNELNLEYLAKGEIKQEDFKVTISDGHGQEEAANVSILLTGTNDNPVSGGFSSGSVTEDSQVLDAHGLEFWIRDLQETGSFEFGDPDFSDQHYISVISPEDGVLGNLYASVSSDTDGVGGPGTVDWSYSLSNRDAEYLAEGESQLDRFNVTVRDSSGGSFDHTVEVLISGTNDAPAISQADDYGRVQKVANADPGRHYYDHGFIHFTDYDLTDSHVISSITSMDTLGDITAVIKEDSTGSGNGVIEWEYSVADNQLDDANAGRGEVDRFTITLDDGNGGTDTQEIGVYISGGQLYQSFENFTGTFTAANQSMWGTDSLDYFGFGHDEFYGVESAEPFVVSIDKDLEFIRARAAASFDYKIGVQSTLGAGTGVVNADLEYDFYLNTTYDTGGHVLSIYTQAEQLSGDFETNFSGLNYDLRPIFYAKSDWFAYFDAVGFDRINVPSPPIVFGSEEGWSLFNIDVSPITTASSGTGSLVEAEGKSSNLLSYDVDLVSEIFYLLGSPNPFHFKLPLYVLDVDFALVAPELEGAIYIGQDFEMAGANPNGIISLEIEETGEMVDFGFTFGDRIEIASADQYTTDEQGNILYEVTIDPSARFDSRTSIDASLDFEFRLLEIGIEYDLYVDKGTYNIGPFYSYDPAPYEFVSIELFHDNFELDFSEDTYDFSLMTTEGNNQAPWVPQVQYFSLEENQVPGSMGTSRATDYEGDRMFFDILSGNQDGYFSIDRYTGELFSTQSLDYEHDVRQYDLEVEVIDYEGGISIYTASVELQNILEGIFFTKRPPSEITLDENGPVTSLGILSARDPDETSITYSISAGNDDHLFYLNPDTKELLVNSLDYEQANKHDLVLTAEDADGESIDYKVVVNVNDLPENGSDFTVVESVFTSDENLPARALGNVELRGTSIGDLVYAITNGNDSNVFEISDTGELSILSSLDHEENAQYILTVNVTDGTGFSDDALITVNVNDVAETPVVDDTIFAIDENQPGQTLGFVTASDQDSGDTLSYSIISGNDSALFNINDAGELIVTAPLDYEVAAQYVLEVQVTDSSGLSDVATVTVNVNDVNEAPSNQVGNIVYSDVIGMVFAENSPAGQFIRDLNLHDPEGEAVDYEIVAGNSDGLFAVDSAGVVTTTGSLDYEDGEYSLSIRASDPTGLYTDRAFNVAVNNVLSTDLTANVDENSAEVLLGSVAEDVADTDVTYAITSGNDDSQFRVDASTGEIWTTGDLDYETQTSHELIVTTSDNEGVTDTATVNIIVNDVDENTSPLTAYDSVFYYATDAGYSLSSGIDLTDPLGNVLYPTVRVDGGATSYVVSSSDNGTGSFADRSSPTYDFVVDADFEIADSIGSFVYSVNNGGTPVEGTVTVQSFTDSSVYSWYGGTGNDVFVGGTTAKYIHAGDGNDTVLGGDGNDAVYHLLSESAGSDFVDGGAGIDTYRLYTEGTEERVFVIEGDGSVVNVANSGQSQELHAIENVVLYATDGYADIKGSVTGDFSGTDVSRIEFYSDYGYVDIDASTAVYNSINVYGKSGSANFIGGTGRDVFFMYGGDNNTFSAGEGNDQIIGGGQYLPSSIDADGGDGYDTVTLRFGSNDPSILEVIAGTGSELQMTLNGKISSLSNFEKFTITSQNETNTGSLDVTFSGDFDGSLGGFTQGISRTDGVLNFDASSVVSSTPFYVSGSTQSDDIVTGYGNDQIFGEAGNDVLNGGTGADQLTGGDGNDRFIFDGQAFAQLLSDPTQKDTVIDYEAGEIFDLTDIFDYVLNTLGGQIDSIVNDISAGTSDGALQVNYSDDFGAHSVVLADLTGYTGEISFEPPLPEPSNITAYDSVFYYETDAGYSLASGINLTDPFGNTVSLDPTVRVDGGATSYAVTNSVNGTGSFFDPVSQVYDFVVDAAFEATDSTGSFVYSANNGGTPVEGTVTIKSFTGSNSFIDYWYGEAGNDVFVGGATGRQVYAGEGDDIILGSSTTDRLYGESGDDVIYGFSGLDHFYGGEGNDTLFGGADNDSFYYVPGAASGNDFVDGGDGYDVYYIFTEGTDDTILSFNADGGAQLEIGAFGQTQTMQSIGRIDYIGREADASLTAVLTGDFSSLDLTFLRFNNEGYTNIDASGSTGKGIEVTANSASADFFGGDAVDIFYINDGVLNNFNGGGGDDLIRFTDSLGTTDVKVNADGGDGTDLVQLWIGRDDSYTIEVVAGEGDNSGDIQMSLNGQVSQLTNIERFDLQDLASTATNQIDITFLGDFTDSLLYQSISMYDSAINLDASAVTSLNKFYSYGGSSADTLLTGAGDDVLGGKAGDDILNGGGGNDKLIGGDGDDQLSGGLGNDTFVFEDNWGKDVVTDFEDGFDRLDLRGNTAVTGFDDLSVVQDGADTVISIDDVVDGDTITLIGVNQSLLTSDDFYF